MLLGSSSEANLRTQLLPRTVRRITGVQALAIKRSACGLFTNPEPVTLLLLSEHQETLRRMLQRNLARSLPKVVRAKTSSRHTLLKSLLTTTPSETIPPTSSRRSWTSTNESSACGLNSAGRSLSA